MLHEELLEITSARGFVDEIPPDLFTKMNIANQTPIVLYFQGLWNTNEEQSDNMGPVFKGSRPTDINTRLIAWFSACCLITVGL